MANKKSEKRPSFTVQARLVLIAEVEVEANSFEEALQLGKTWSRKDIVDMQPSTSEIDSKITLTGAYSSQAWSVD
jgi:hypothetical protein